MSSLPAPQPGFAVCHSCDPPRLIPVAGVLAHLTEHHLSTTDITSAEVTSDETPPLTRNERTR